MTILNLGFKSVKQVRQTEAAKKIRVILVEDKHGKHIAQLHAYLSTTNRGFQWRVDIFDEGSLTYQTKGRNLADALAGTTIHHIRLYAECEYDLTTDRMLKRYTEATKRGNSAAARRAAVSIDNMGAYLTNPDSEGVYQSCVYKAGLDRLEQYGYKVTVLL